MVFLVEKIEEEFKQLGIPNILKYPTLPNLTRKTLKESNVHNYIDIKDILSGSKLKKYNEHTKRMDIKFTQKISSLEEITAIKV
jgi:hypothetical protein